MHRDAHLLNRYLDPETGTWLTDYFAKHGVTMLMGESLNGFEGKTVLRNIQTKSGNRVPAASQWSPAAPNRISILSATRR